MVKAINSLTSITIPNSVTSIEDRAFYGCSCLTSITIPDSVKSIGSGAFYNCSSLTSVTIGNGVTSIGASAFYDCSSLTSITIPNSLTSIRDGAFYNCYPRVYYKGTAEQWSHISISSYYNSLYMRYYYSESKPTNSGNYWYYDKNSNITVW